MSISQRVQESMKSSSWIRKMFETGQILKQRYGDDKIFDFSLGSPVLEPPETFANALRELATHPKHGMHRYMPNNGFLSTRQAVAKMLSRAEQVEMSPENIIMTVGAAGAINVVLSAILELYDETIILAPYFVEYFFYVQNHGGTPRVVETTEDYDLDLAAIERAINSRTKAIIINTPNNPTGRIYTHERIIELAGLLARAEKKYGTTIYLIVDTPYAKITYENYKNPPLLLDHPNTLLAHSFSKDLGLAGERIGYLAISPRAPHCQALQSACTFTMRTLGFVNAPSLIQLAIEQSLDASVDLDQYRRLRDKLCTGLEQMGYQFFRPQGAFYLFLKSPIPDDIQFMHELKEENVLVVPGAGFGRPGYVRLSFCVEEIMIDRALPYFEKVMRRVQGRS